MCQKLLRDPRFFEFLFRCDQETAKAVRSKGCPRCGGRLHRADFGRKPRGALCGLGRGYQKRLSLCCAAQGCRKRQTPPSVRYLGPKVYLAAVVVLVTAMQHGVNAARARELQEAVGVSRQTLNRWRVFWQQLFVTTRFWQHAQARFSPPVALEALPQSLLERFAGDLASQLSAMLQFLAPLTANSTRN